MATPQTAEDMRRKLFDDDEADRGAVKEAYDQTVSNSAARRAPIAQLQRAAKLFLKWDDLDRPKRKAANALKILSQVPLSVEGNVSYSFEASLRQSFAAALNESAEYDSFRQKMPPGERAQNHEIRGIFWQAIRIDAAPEDISRINRAIKKLRDDEEAAVDDGEED
jgi:hypothetical protein